MGVPALFRWLSQKYPKIVSPVIEEQPREIDGQIIPIDTRGPNPNNEEFDNLYLDMNGIVHPCSHPEDRPAPKDEEEMMLEIFKYTDRVVNMVRPRKLLMIAIDGVAPRAKMNQQRSRRFRSAQEAKEKEEDKATLLKMLKSQGGHVEEPVIKKAWDSNEITPGTPFMDILAASLRYWIALKLNTDPAWAKMKVIISDSTVPGEGEHKIMEFIRSQRSSPEHDPNTKHVIYGLDADLIMLGLGTHEPHFRVLREDVFAQDSKPRTCHLCGQAGHEARECTGEAKVKDGDFDEKDSAPALKPFIWLHVSILREYLAAELYVPSQPFRFDLERAIDDWVFMCFFVGNDFLPHLPSLEIRENGIDTLIAIWRDNIPYMGGYLTKDGHVDLERAQFILDGLAKQEDAIFRRRKQTEERREAGAKRRKLESERGGRGGRGGGRGGFQGSPTNGRKSSQVSNGPEGLPLFAPGDITKEAKLMTHDMVVNRGAIYKANLANKSAAAALKSQISGQGYADETSPKGNLIESPASALGKRKADLVEDDDISSTPGRTTPNPGTPSPSDEPAIDIVRLWDEGYADRYYESKFHVDPRDLEFRHKVGRAYVEGLAWVLLYYFQGCPSWDWYYPYHYAPFAADFVNIADVKLRFEKGQIFRPFEQLMGVLPAASRQAIPEIFHDLMTSPDSEIIDFYPEDFTVDLNGKKFAWQGVALLPFIDSRRLLDAMAKRYPLLPPDVAARNGVGKDVLLVAEAHTKLYDDIATNFYSKKKGEGVLKLNPRSSEGLTGKVEKDESYMPHGSLAFPLQTGAMPTLDDDRSITVHYEIPKSSHIHKSMLLRGVKFPPPSLNQADIEATKGRAAKSGRNHGGVPLNGDGRGRNSFNYASGPGQSSNRGRGGSHNRNNYNGGNQYPVPPPGWQPPPLGASGLPPPPPMSYQSFSHGQAPPPAPYGYPPPPGYGPPPGYNGSSNRRGGDSYRGRGGRNQGTLLIPGGSSRGMKPVVETAGSWKSLAYGGHSIAHLRGTHHGFRYKCGEFLVDLLSVLSSKPEAHIAYRIPTIAARYLGLWPDLFTAMNGDLNLVVSLVDRLTTRLPHRTGSYSTDLYRDELVVLTRATLVNVSTSTIGVVVETIVRLLEDISRPYKGLITHPLHVAHSELFILGLLADCCSTHWASLNTAENDTPEDSEEFDSEGSDESGNGSQKNGPHRKSNGKPKKEPRNGPQTRKIPPVPLDDDLAIRLLDIVKLFSNPVPENYVLPASNILDDAIWGAPIMDIAPIPESIINSSGDRQNDLETPNLLKAKADIIESYSRTILEYISCSNWSRVLEYLRQALRGLRGNPALDDTSALVTIRLISCFWVDSRKLTNIIQELCGSFLHLRKAFQTTVAIALPLLITRWLERNPEEFIELHTMHKRLDGGADTLFDMAQTMIDSSRRRSLLFLFQTSLLFLLPDVFEVASNMRDAKSSNISKKVQFLEMLRKALRSRNESAIYCLVAILRVARHFPLNSDAALLSYALDVQDEIREAVFRKSAAGVEISPVDRGLITATFVSLVHLNFESAVETLTPSCLTQKSSPDFQIAAISACTHFTKQPNSSDYAPLYDKVMGFVQKQLLQPSVNSRDSFPDEQYTISASRLDVLTAIFMFLEASAVNFGRRARASDWRDISEGRNELFIDYMRHEDDHIRLLAQTVALRLMKEGVVSYCASGQNVDIALLKSNFWKSTSTALISLSEYLLEGRGDEKSKLNFIHDYIKARFEVLKEVEELVDSDDEFTERANASAGLETCFLVALCSADISHCQVVTRCISVFCDETQYIDSRAGSGKHSQYTLRNIDVYRELASREFRFTGLVAFQKRVRGLLRQMEYPTAGILTAWEVIFEKWLKISRQVFANPSETVDEKTLVEWRNFSGFLASLGGTCMSDSNITMDEPGLAGLKWVDRLSTDSHDDTILSRYMKQSIQLLASSNVRIRESTREVLSSDLSKALYMPLFESLEAELEALFDSSRANAAASIEARLIFAEQAASVLKGIVDKLGGPTEVGTGLVIDIGALTLNFAKFLNDLPEIGSTLRVKIKICQLCETVTQKKELLNLRHDVRIRNQLLEVIFRWIARPSSPKIDNSVLQANNRADEFFRLQRDLDRASLKALADLTYRLPLQPAEGQTDADTSDLKGQMFQTYFNRFLSLLNYETNEITRNEVRLVPGTEEYISTSEYAIVALSNLLSANIDVGLKLSLSIGYAEDLDIRTAFVKVLCNILIQGTEFNNLSDASVNQKYDALLELLVNDMALTIALCDACPSSEVDEMTISLLNIFDSRGLGFALLEALIEHEVDETENEAELLRRNCVATKMLSVYARWKGQAYLKTTLQTVIERLIMAAKDLDLELDPARTSSAEELRKNSVQLRVVTRVFVEDICASADNIPVSFRKICSIISSAVMKRFPEAKFTAVGAFIFLRFFCPAIVAPDVEGLTATTPSKEMRRGLLLIAKVVQNLANNVLFGAKEPYMFPLNDFLTENIYRVTTFLREISVPPKVLEPISETESFDFGSCVALHRFLYDHWDHVRQKLVLRERKLSVRSKREIPTGQTPILEFLRKLISNLGPPPMDVSWNRPTIVSNTPPSYSRFQHFMLRNAGRSTESVISSRAVYDGGESKDGLSMICIILRNIDTENTDYDLLLYVYLKIASRMWHRPFGILIDATCYNGQNEPQDALFRKLDLLTPSELTKQLSRIYVYNMNSAFRKCFRRILRLSAKSDNSAFHPKNVDYHLLGNLQDLQTHFHLSQLHLPKETISVVTDTRFVFQPIVRLSKTKGKIDVLIKVGSQFVQVTTMKKQEVVLGLRLHATVNDIFRLSEVEEAPTSIQTEDDSAFGLRTENGKIVMYFTSSRKADVLQSIRTAKLKFGKELKTLRSFERLVRPQDVPGTLLNIALTNMASSDQVLRLASYNLLCALCRAFNFTTDSKFMSTKELCVPMNPSHFIIDISQQLAQSEPQLTADFLNEFFVGWEFFPYSQRPLSLTYMAPWLPGLRTSLIATDADGDKAREKVASIFRKLIDVAISDVTLSTTLEQNVWPAIARDEIYNDIFLEEVVKTALGFGIDDYRTEILGSIIASLGIITIRGRLLSRLRKALNRTSLRPTRYLPENTVWNEICVLLRLCLSTSFDSRAQSQLYLPELFHLVTMLANTGSHETRLLVHRLLVNTVHAIYTNFPLEESQSSRLKVLLMTISEPRNDTLFNSSTREGSMTSTLDLGVSALAATEALAVLLSEISVVAAPSIDMSNAWRSRWMSLVASTAFQSNYAIQPRAFTVMGCLAREEVDDDLLYQVLVALRNSIARFVEDNDPEMLISIVSSLTKMMDKLPTTSRYALQLFWLAISLVRLVPLPLFNTAAMFVSSVVLNISTSGDFQNGKMAAVLINGRSQIEDATLQIDELYGVHFSLESFHCAIIATLVKGLTDPITRDTTQRTISTFLKITAMNMAPGLRFPNDPASIPYLALLITRSITKEESLDHLWLSGMNPIDIGEDPIGNIDLDRVRDKELLLLSAITMVDFKYLEEGIQLCGLTWLNSLAIRRPTVALHLASPILAVLESIIMSCQNPRTLESAHVLLRTITGNEKFATVGDTEDLVGGVLEEIGFGGLWRSSSFHFSDGVRERARGDSASDNQSAKEREGWERATAALIDRLIELIIA